MYYHHQKIQLMFAALFGALSIIMASVGAHALHEQLQSAHLLVTFHKAVDYAMYHALALMAIVVLQQCFPKVRFWLVGYLWVLGTVLFSGSLFLHTVAGWHRLTALTPVGGTLMIVGWLLLAIFAYRTPLVKNYSQAT